ncbi:MAG TPA: SDR family oxidoreductase [Solirubrobacteraceae bacterium]|nr:SDR family oxidoreductase [Solirubrobacteraceae bacterium]
MPQTHVRSAETRGRLAGPHGDEQVVLVTGAGAGIGRAIAGAYADAGARVVAVDVASERGSSVAAELRAAGAEAEFVECDVADDDSFAGLREHVLSSYGHVDVLVNNVGVLQVGKPHELGLADWRHAFEVDLLSVVRGVQAFVPSMLERGRGAVVNTCSLGALMPVNPDGAALVTMKAAVFGLSQSLRLTLDPLGITVVCLCPGQVRTEAHAGATAVGIRAAGFQDIELREPEDVARAVLNAVRERRFLAVTDESHAELWAQRFQDLDAALAADIEYLNDTPGGEDR